MSYRDAKDHADKAQRSARAAAAAGEDLQHFTTHMGLAVAELAAAVSELAEQQHRDS
jgi:hypothetical protein